MELFTNSARSSRYVYPRAKTTEHEGQYKRLTIDGNNYLDVWITGVPDGVSPAANEARVKKGEPRRLYVYSDQPLDDSYLETVDSFYGTSSYPMLELTEKCGNLPNGPPRENNFYVASTGYGKEAAFVSPPRVDANFEEYRYLRKRHQTCTSICYDPVTGDVFRLCLPKRSAMLVLYMPPDFIRTGPKRGYFLFDSLNLIVRVYSKYPLLANTIEVDNNLVSEVSVANIRQTNLIKNIFVSLGFHNIYTPSSSQIVAKDKYLTAVVGNISDLHLP